MLVWNDGLKELGQRSLEEVMNEIMIKGREVSKTIDQYFEFLRRI